LLDDAYAALACSFHLSAFTPFTMSSTQSQFLRILAHASDLGGLSRDEGLRLPVAGVVNDR
jgi:hypothetical protein